MSLLEIKAINRWFGTGENRVQVLKDINLSIEKGDFVAIIGQSGSGKSTLMNIIGCLDVPSSGSYKIDGVETAAMTADEQAALRRRSFGFIFQRYNLLGTLTARENVALPAVYAGMEYDERMKRADELLAQLGLAGKEENRPSELSGGQQQRVSIARALMNGGEIILADEPTGALDTGSGKNVMEILHKLHDAGHTIVMVTHDPTIAANANRVIEISDGRIIADHSKNTDIPPSNIESIEEHNSWHFYRDQFFESFLMSIQAIMAHKMRSFLTMLGIIIGIASVVSVVALGRGSQEKILENINAMGTNTVSVYPGYGYGDRRSSRIKTLTVGDAEVLKQQDYVDSVTPGVNTSGTLTYDNQSLSAQLYGVGDQYFDVRGIKLAFGRLFNEDDVTQNSQVVVIDDNTKNKLFADGTNPLGKVILFNKRPLRIIGVTEPNNNGFSDSDSLQMFTPYTTLMNRISGSKYITSVTVKVKDNVNSQTAEKGIIELLKVRHGTEDFFTRNSDTIKQTIESTTGTMTLLISSIALISLVVGGIGVMNIMLVSVTERVKEIGIRMAIGARQHNILEQFLIEAVLICLIGGLVGVLFSFAISMLFNLLATDFAMSFSTISIVMAVLCSSVIGVLFGFMPAKRASQLNPIDALSRD
ncbi:macrolide ABC transporter permease/ATP-binding protein MacB [Snodgrassella alvi]|uniref:MacB family efflux pump subunit n=1 Tax=Snodgrassella alvi TaxID=1196083 RepID=UPI000A077E25|nr:MacB family efflux pump subunit [Snodgrassella alvi]ORF24253.1 macrolide ABC transporter permease/ATP-binding protein MacB [Snodgrassella alvi]ORF32134.1 macrolide ABC transporter permease/ATP-binding protein MacB [Snodgrassella alvi]ORF32316.1 macrolide ABC transporter permease/ATP-binding protein MacB [Snodgrassella alvi]ORF33110.1 macrolide ABC transporter permease/ATP-binding protein MacB [Snodgrassella alvi]ORF37564.1 macrolide ABC transporter permease/ATP-binding protein MacB [Snodgra